MPKLLISLALLALFYSPLFSAKASDDENSYDRVQREQAAEYRLNRAKFKAPAGYDTAARKRLSEIKNLLKHGEVKIARKLADKSYRKDFPYSTYTADILQVYIETFLPKHQPEGKKHKIYTQKIYKRMNDLWLRFPDHDGMRETFTQILEAAEFIQQHGTVINVHAENMEEAVQRSWGLHLNAIIDLYTFLETNGDKHNIAPRASLGIARIYLIQGTSDPRKLFMARAKYLQFLARYPDNNLAFDALIEQAYCYLIAYRGDKFDVGVMIEAAYILKQAELYADQREDRLALVKKLRDLIRRSHQARDFQVAKWYQDKGHDKPAMYYYKEVIKRDPASSKGLDAARILDEMERRAAGKEVESDQQ